MTEEQITQKANELVGKFMQYTPAEEQYEFPFAKECAIICVDEIIASQPVTVGYEWAINNYKAIKEKIKSL
jgi:hypothetical protein